MNARSVCCFVKLAVETQEWVDYDALIRELPESDGVRNVLLEARRSLMQGAVKARVADDTLVDKDEVVTALVQEVTFLMYYAAHVFLLCAMRLHGVSAHSYGCHGLLESKIRSIFQQMRTCGVSRGAPEQWYSWYADSSNEKVNRLVTMLEVSVSVAATKVEAGSEAVEGYPLSDTAQIYDVVYPSFAEALDEVVDVTPWAQELNALMHPLMCPVLMLLGCSSHAVFAFMKGLFTTEWLAGDDFFRHLMYWQEQLKGTPFTWYEQTDEEQQHEDAQLGEEGDLALVLDHGEDGRAQNHARQDVADDRRLAQLRHDHAAQQRGEHHDGERGKLRVNRHVQNRNTAGVTSK